MHKAYNILKKQCEMCKECELFKGRNNVVFGKGNPDSNLMIIGEGPGVEEDMMGLPFVGKSGVLLKEALHDSGISPNKVYISNVIKCRPPNNRTPLPEEIKKCSFFLTSQIGIVKPKYVITLGLPASRWFDSDIKTMRSVAGKESMLHFNCYNEIIPFLWYKMYHPSYALRNGKKGRIEFKASLDKFIKIMEGLVV